MIRSLCESCASLREVTSPKGSRFLLCLLSVKDPRYQKYPPQPIVQCKGFQCRPDIAEQKPIIDNLVYDAKQPRKVVKNSPEDKRQ
jgi:hypothetical protein